MKGVAVVLPFAILAWAACNKAPNSTSLPPTGVQPSAEAVSTAVVIPDPAAEHRAQLLARVDKLNNSDCDALVLEFQIIPRDEILNSISAPKKDLLRYVKRIASAEDLDAIERAISERSRSHKR